MVIIKIRESATVKAFLGTAMFNSFQESLRAFTFVFVLIAEKQWKSRIKTLTSMKTINCRGKAVKKCVSLGECLGIVLISLDSRVDCLQNGRVSSRCRHSFFSVKFTQFTHACTSHTISKVPLYAESCVYSLSGDVRLPIKPILPFA
jgi:predicted RecB family endonuclease